MLTENEDRKTGFLNFFFTVLQTNKSITAVTKAELMLFFRIAKKYFSGVTGGSMSSWLKTDNPMKKIAKVNSDAAKLKKTNGFMECSPIVKKQG